MQLPWQQLQKYVFLHWNDCLSVRSNGGTMRQVTSGDEDT